MTMATEFAPRPAVFPKRINGGRESGPNPFIDEGWLDESYQTGEARAVDVPGTWETRVKKTADGEPDGEREVLVGEAGKVVSQLRAAARFLDIGVAIDTRPAKYKNGKDIVGIVTVTYVGKEPKNTKKRQAAVEPDEIDE